MLLHALDDKINRLTCVLVNPTKKLLNTPKNKKMRASSLKLCTHRIADGHFFRDTVPDLCVKTIREIDFRVAPTEYHARVLEASAEFLKCKARLLKGSAENESETRYCICNPIVSMMCDAFKYVLKLEETVRESRSQEEEEEEEEEKDDEYLSFAKDMWDQLCGDTATAATGVDATGDDATMDVSDDNATARQSIGFAMSEESRADYSVYTLSEKQGPVKVIAIIDGKKSLVHMQLPR